MSTVMVVVPQLDRFLTVAKKFDPRNVNFPHGAIKPRESPIEAAFRVLFEQTHVQAKEARLIPAFPQAEGRLFVYLVTDWHHRNPVSSTFGKAAWTRHEPLLRETSDDRAWAQLILAGLRRI